MRAAGTGGKIYNAGRGAHKVVRLPSLKSINLNRYCRAAVGANANRNYRKQNCSKAGTRRRLGGRLCVRGLAMNAADHPHGGQSGPSRTSVSPWG